MTIQEWFDKRKEAQIERRAKEIKGVNNEAPDLWTKCVHCDSQLLKSDLEENLMVCPHCDYHYRINATQLSIAVLCGRSDHTTVIHAEEKIKKEIETDESIRNTIETIIKKINPS